MTPEPWVGAPRPPREWQARGLPVVVEAMRGGRRPLVSAVPGAGKSVLMAELVWLALHRAGDRAVVVSAPKTMLVEQLSATIAERCGSDAVGQWWGKRKQAERRVVVACNDSMGTLAAELAGKGRRVALCVVDEGHRSEADEVKAAIARMAPRSLVGFTGTPFRSVESEMLSLFDCIPIRYTLADAIRDGVLVPPRIVGWDGGDSVPIDEACLEMIRAHGRGPGIVSAASTDDADAYSDWLVSRGIRAAAVHSKVPARVQAERIAGLRSGALDAVVHVSMLAEGVDYPWLRWICLRRKVGASVRFIQEGLRVGRSEPGKVEGVILDPHCLFGRFGWTTPERIGLALEQEAEASTTERPATTREPSVELAVSLDALVEALEQVHAGMAAGGLVKAAAGDVEGWMLAPVSERQVEAIGRCSRLTRHVPREAREQIRALTRVPWALNRGQASTLLDVLIGGAKWARAEAGPDGDAFRLSWSPRMLPRFYRSTADDARSVRLWGERVARREAAV